VLYLVLFIVLDTIEQSKLVFIFNEDVETYLIISSLLEKLLKTICWCIIVDIDVDFENFIFIYLEINYEVNLYNFCITLFRIIDINIKYHIIISRF